MLTKVKDKINNINNINKAAGVEIILLPDNRYTILLTVLALDKKSIVIEKKEQVEEGNIEILKNSLDKDIPVYLILNGRGILHKKISESGSDNNALIQLVLPNAKIQDFYVQNIPSEKSCLISIIRKELADPILNTIQKMGLYCIDFSLGGMAVSAVLPLLADTTNSTILAWAEHSMDTDLSGSVTDYKYLGNSLGLKTFQLDAEKIEDKFLLSYAGAFSILSKNEPVVPFVESVKHNKEEFLNKQLFKKMSWSVMGFFFVVLMVNFILFASYSSRNNELRLKDSKYSSMFSDMERLSKEVKEKESFLFEAGWLQPSSMTYYADRIAATVPPSVKLTELSVNPIDERKSKDEKKQLFATGLIVLKGDCTRPTELNEWLDKIKSINKIIKARLVHYSYDNKDSKGSFSIEIQTEN